MPVPSAITDLSTSAAGNSPAGSDTVFPNLDDYIRALSAFIAQNYASLATKQASLGYTPVNKAGDTLTGVLAATKGTAALPGIAFSGDTNTGIHSSGADILDLVTAGVAQWRVDASGRLVAPARKQPCFRAENSANNIVSGADYTTYSAETDDTSAFDGASGVFTVPIAGWYAFSANVTAMTSSGAGLVYVRISISGGGAITVSLDAVSTAGKYAQIESGPIYLAAGATVKLINAGLSGSISSNVCRHFSGRLLG